MYHTIWGEGSVCDKIISEMAEQGWRVISFGYIAMNEVQVPTEAGNEVIHVPCFSYLLEHSSIHQSPLIQQDVPTPPRKFIGMKG